MREKGKRVHAPSVLVLVAALNEEVGIRFTLAELKRYLPGSVFLVIDGHSRDRTVAIAKDLGAEVVFQKGKGKGDAIASGLAYEKRDFEYSVLIDADYTYPAAYIPRMIRILESNSKVGMVCGNRFNSKLEIGAMGDFYYFGNRLLALTHNMINSIDMHDPLSGLRVIRWDILKNWQPKSTGFDIEVELNNYVIDKGYEIQEIEIPYRERVGKKKLKLKHGFTILNRILIGTFSEKTSGFDFDA